MDKAVAYLRVSGRGQVEGDGFPRQLETISRYAKANGLALDSSYRDEGISGTSELADRPGLAALLDRIESNGVTVVLVENASRLARDLMIAEVILAQFRAQGVTVIEADGGNDLTVGGNDPTGKLIRQILGAVSEFDKNVTVLKLRAARERKRREGGKCEGRKAFGTTAIERETLTRMKHLARKPRNSDRRSYGQIAELLNSEGCRTRTGRPWNRGTIFAILKRQ